jgi:Nucleotidyl transferase AbiEii toxin, Type IV TA system
LQREKEFALKGGTAINLFLRDMPRLSVDIDPTYVPVADRRRSLKGIDSGMKRIADGIKKGVPTVELSTSTQLCRAVLAF